ncbi:MAG: 4Fe-4S binding protein [Spirochaetaceae bacterium]|jgi:NAD-dependent dihydropyrimidine dehydrogenase PreA subunit|nr:4Fe-4S binding protein [Spirochaetaceae bacterium]
MTRKIVRINAEKCDGCGLCADACHEGAIEIQGGKAVLIRDDYCDGLGNCLPACPKDAVSIEEREALPFDEAAVAARMPAARTATHAAENTGKTKGGIPPFSLDNWPIQLKLAHTESKKLEGTPLLIAADCTAFADPALYADIARGKAVLIGCPKLDGTDYSEKIAAILCANNTPSVTALKMEVPCCGGIAWFVKKALEKKSVPCRVVTLLIHGGILEEE